MLYEILCVWELDVVEEDLWTYIKHIYWEKTYSEPQSGIESAIFWWPVRHSNQWATESQTENYGFR